MRIWIKRIGIVLLIPVVLILLVSVLLYIPPVQNFAVKQAAYYAGKATGMQIGIERIRLSFPLNLTVRGVEVLTAPTDTLLTLKSLSVNVQALPLLKKEVLVDAINLEGVKVNTGTFIEGMEIKGVLGRLYAKADRIPATERYDNESRHHLHPSQLDIETGKNQFRPGGVCHADACRLVAPDYLYR